MYKAIIQLLTTLVSVIRLKSDIDPESIIKGLEDCSKNIRKIKMQIKREKHLGTKQHLLATLQQLQSLRAQIKAQRKIGLGTVCKETAKHRVKWLESLNAFQNRIRNGIIANIGQHKEPKDFLNDCQSIFKRRIETALKEHYAVKVNTVFSGEFILRQGDRESTETKYITTSNAPIYRDTKIAEWFDTNVTNKILTALEEFQERDSGWALKSIANLGININKFTHMLGSSYIELPKQILKKRACLNIKNNDSACFAWAVNAALNPTNKQPELTESYPHYSKGLKLQGIQFPMTFKQIPNFQKQNVLSVNVYALEKSRHSLTVVPAYLTKNKQKRHVNLLLIQDNYDDEFKVPKLHYVLIKDLSRLVSMQLSKLGHKKHICDRCLCYFKSAEKLNLHEADCIKLNKCKLELPSLKNNKIKFKNFKNKEKNPFVIYADFECLLEPTDKRNAFQQHTPCSVGYYVKCTYDDTLSFYKQHTGLDCRAWFVKELQQFAEDVETVFLCPLPMDKLTFKQIREYYTAKNCHVCEKPFDGEDNRKVRDHCHLTGKYRGPAHFKCNLNYRDDRVIPVIFHNLSGYDSHFILENLAQDFPGRVDLLPITKEKYISFKKNVDENLINFRFIDSYRFMATGLDKLASYMPDYPELKNQFVNVSAEKFRLLTRKGVYPYDYMDSFDKLDETALPDITKFYNKLNDSYISQTDYEHAQNVWSNFDCKNLRDYTELYMKTDIMLLADVFEKFRNTCMNTYSLDPAHYYTLPGFTWDAMLKFTKIELELFTEADMVSFIELGIRGGLSQCSKRYAKANNKYMPNYDSTIPSKYIVYNDIVNQYGWAMSQFLPYKGFEWVEDIDNLNWNVDNESDFGYILQVDLDYPKHLHDKHADLPFCPERKPPPKSREDKLLATVENKSKYIIHYRNLRQAIENGLILKKIHKVLKFKQAAWLKSYIDLNTSLRMCAQNDFEKNLYKLMNNAVFGKTMENVRHYSNVRLVTKWDGRYGAEALIAKPTFKSVTVFNDNLVAIELNKSIVMLNKPIYVGMCILDISKTKIYDFQYNYITPKFGANAHALYTDTDSLIHEIECDDYFDSIRPDLTTYFDTSDYPVNNVYNFPRVNKKVLGLMSDECNGKIMTEFVGLRSKMYAYRIEGKDKDKKAKGVKRNVIMKEINFDDYVYCLNNVTEKVIQQNLIKAEKHKVHTVIQNKIGLSSHDDKRYLIPNSVETLPWGHYKIPPTSTMST